MHLSLVLITLLALTNAAPWTGDTDLSDCTPQNATPCPPPRGAMARRSLGSSSSSPVTPRSPISISTTVSPGDAGKMRCVIQNWQQIPAVVTLVALAPVQKAIISNYGKFTPSSQESQKICYVTRHSNNEINHS